MSLWQRQEVQAVLREVVGLTCALLGLLVTLFGTLLGSLIILKAARDELF